MDLMRTLLIYMSATLTLAVQNTAAPKETPTPTPVPAAIVETVATPAPGASGDIATAAPAEKQDGQKKKRLPQCAQGRQGQGSQTDPGEAD